MATIVYLHGANSTGNAFNFIRQNLAVEEDHEEVVIEYDCQIPFLDNLERMKKIVEPLSDIIFIAHSLGGVYALFLANTYPSKVIGAITLSTPYGGSATAQFLKYAMPSNQLLKDIDPYGRVMQRSAKCVVIHPWVNIVTKNGNSMMLREANDGVVTVASMKLHKDMELIEINSNHYEVLVNYEVVYLINRKIFDYSTAQV